MLEFHSENHEYRWDGEKVISVTQLLPKVQFFCSPEQLEAARVEGNDNHSMVKMFWDTGETFDDPYLESFRSWYEDNKTLLGEILLYEQPLFSKKLNYAGTPDMFFTNAIVDLKRTPGNVKYHALQFAGYNLLRKEAGMPGVKKWILLWHDGKEFKTKNVYNPQAEGIFKSLVMRWNIEQQINNYLKGV